MVAAHSGTVGLGGPRFLDREKVEDEWNGPEGRGSHGDMVWMTGVNFGLRLHDQILLVGFGCRWSGSIVRALGSVVSVRRESTRRVAVVRVGVCVATTESQPMSNIDIHYIYIHIFNI
jgi:hypothetical protein